MRRKRRTIRIRMKVTAKICRGRHIRSLLPSGEDGFSAIGHTLFCKIEFISRLGGGHVEAGWVQQDPGPLCAANLVIHDQPSLPSNV